MQCFTKCDTCIHKKKDLKDGWIPCCKAFPEGIPDELWETDTSLLKECCNGIKYERDPEWEGW